jgi:hypothetical protein
MRPATSSRSPSASRHEWVGVQHRRSPEARLTISAATTGEARPVLRARSPSMAQFVRLLAKMNAAPSQCGRVHNLVASSTRNEIAPPACSSRAERVGHRLLLLLLTDAAGASCVEGVGMGHGGEGEVRVAGGGRFLGHCRALPCSPRGRTFPRLWCPRTVSPEGLCAGSPWPLGMIPAANHIYASRCARWCATCCAALPWRRYLAL